MFPEAFRKRIANTTGSADEARLQATPEVPYFTESGFTPEFTGLDLDQPGVADTGTRLVARFNNVPDGTFLIAPDRVVSRDFDGNELMIEARRVKDFEADFSGGELVRSSDREEWVPTPGGSGALVYEISARAPFENVTDALVLDRIHIPVRAVFAQPNTMGGASVVLSYGPLDAINTTSQPAPEPRFFNRLGNDSIFAMNAGAAVDHVSLRYTPSDPVPVSRVVSFASDPVDAAFIEVIAGGAWLQAIPDSNGQANQIDFSANPAGLTPGRYNGAVKMRLEGDLNKLVIVPVILDVTAAPELAVDTTPLELRAVVGDAAPATRTLFVGSHNKNLTFTIAASTTSGGNWLSVTPNTGRTPLVVTISATPGRLMAGRYEGALSIQAENASNSPRTIPVSFVVTPPLAAFPPSGVVNAASYVGGGVAPGELVTIFGDHVGSSPPAGGVIGPDNRLATMVADIRVLFDGVPAPIVATSSTQTSCVVPFNVQGKSSVAVQVEIKGFKSAPVTVPVLAALPGIFSANASGQGQGAILNQDGSLNTPENPAAPGSVITLYVTGAGIMQPPQLDGAITSGPNPPAPVASLVARIGGVEAYIEYYGAAPGLVAGAIQINIRVPNTPGVAVPVQVVIGGQPSQFVLVSVAEP